MQTSTELTSWYKQIKIYLNILKLDCVQKIYFNYTKYQNLKFLYDLIFLYNNKITKTEYESLIYFKSKLRKNVNSATTHKYSYD